MPDAGPLGDTFFDAKLRAIAVALRVNKPAGGNVDKVFTPAIHRFFLLLFLLRITLMLASRLLHGIGMHAIRKTFASPNFPVKASKG
jgi:hypothetical protein